MYRVAVVEDSAFERKNMLSYLKQYQEKEQVPLEVLSYSDGSELIEAYPEPLDILLMDIGMEKLDGMKTARLVRRRDTRVVLIFVSSMIQYGLQGYSVDALDFLVKPVSYTMLKLRLDRAIARLEKRTGRLLKIRSEDTLLPISSENITYVEAQDHKVIIHTVTESIPAAMSLKSIESSLAGLSFYRCHNTFLVNLNYVDRLQGNELTINGQTLPISRYKKQEFLEVYSAWEGEGI